MLNNFIYAKTKDLFTAQLQAGNVLDEAIVFIEDTKEIWNHGTYFCGITIDSENLDESVQTALLSKQDTLVSGASIKTINGESILGSGNIKVGNKLLVLTDSTDITLTPNVYYRHTSSNLTSLNITLEAEIDSEILNEYFIEFTTSNSGTTISLPSTVKWSNGVTPTFEENSVYQMSIVNNLGVVTKFN